MRIPLAALLLLALPPIAARAEDPLSSPWHETAPGVTSARAAELGGDSRWGAQLVLVDPAKTQLSVHFDEETPRLPEWRARFPGALLLVNGSYYSLEKTVRPTCELISAGKLLHGAGCRVKDALYFGARAAIPAGQAGPRPRILAPAEFLPAEWSEALKSFPALVRGGAVVCTSSGYCTESSRTAAVAVLRDGRLLFFASQWPAVRKEVAQFLAEQMGAVDALNLDGGPEATLALRDQPINESVSTPGTPLPLVIVVEPAPALPEAPAAKSAPKTSVPAPAQHK